MTRDTVNNVRRLLSHQARTNVTFRHCFACPVVDIATYRRYYTSCFILEAT